MIQGKEYKELYDQMVNIMKLLDMSAILQPHYDSDGHLDGGTIVNNGIINGHIDPTGPKGKEGISGIEAKKWMFVHCPLPSPSGKLYNTDVKYK
jgi:hypothetical protein